MIMVMPVIAKPVSDGPDGWRGLLDTGPLSRDDLMQSMPPLATKH
jgi:hypothetical protein